MNKTFGVIGIVLVLAVAACGGDDKKSTATATTTAGATPSYSGDKSSKFCQLGAEFSQRFNNLSASLAAGAEKAQAEITTLKDVIEQAKDEAPSSIKADVSKLATAFTQFFTQAQAANFDPQAIQSAGAKLVSVDVQQAGAHLQAYGQQVCGISPAG